MLRTCSACDGGDDCEECTNCGGSGLAEFEPTESDYSDLKDERDELESLLKEAYKVMRNGPGREEDAEKWKLIVLRLKARLEAEQ